MKIEPIKYSVFINKTKSKPAENYCDKVIKNLYSLSNGNIDSFTLSDDTKSTTKDTKKEVI